MTNSNHHLPAHITLVPSRLYARGPPSGCAATLLNKASLVLTYNARIPSATEMLELLDHTAHHVLDTEWWKPEDALSGMVYRAMGGDRYHSELSKPAERRSLDAVATAITRANPAERDRVLNAIDVYEPEQRESPLPALGIQWGRVDVLLLNTLLALPESERLEHARRALLTIASAEPSECAGLAVEWQTSFPYRNGRLLDGGHRITGYSCGEFVDTTRIAWRDEIEWTIDEIWERCRRESTPIDEIAHTAPPAITDEFWERDGCSAWVNTSRAPDLVYRYVHKAVRSALRNTD